MHAEFNGHIVVYLVALFDDDDDDDVDCKQNQYETVIADDAVIVLTMLVVSYHLK
ncbi:MAG: hypothetical protein GKS07_08995 [Nitrosopumilus sp.]|nr:MAG: hypothetical protein GKS07_08995 [Nitrosopumilus sp.]